MRLNKITGSLLAGAMTLSVFGVATAQTGKVLGATASKLLAAPGVLAAAGATAGADADADLRAPRPVDLPLTQQVTLARQFVARMEQSSTTVRAQLGQARAARDIVKSLCLNDKLNQIDVVSRSAKDRATTHQSAVDGKDKDRAGHEFMILRVLNDRIEQLVKEANQCIGEDEGFIGDSKVSLSVDPNIPDDNRDQLGSDTSIISEPPSLSSPIN
jgi:hypothetical protein